MTHEMRGMPQMPSSRTDQAYVQLRSMVLNGEFKPGHWLRKRTVADHLKMSPTPVVEAFRLLEQEGLVEIVPKWGARVRTMTCDELEQIFWMRSDIEARVARRVTERAGELGRQLDDLDRLAQEADDAIRAVLADRDHLTGRVGQTVEPDLRFHIQLAHRSGL